jgi:hypothetical protein
MKPESLTIKIQKKENKVFVDLLQIKSQPFPGWLIIRKNFLNQSIFQYLLHGFHIMNF